MEIMVFLFTAKVTCQNCDLECKIDYSQFCQTCWHNKWSLFVYTEQAFKDANGFQNTG